MKKLTPKQQYEIDQVAASMAIEDMPLSEESYQNLVDIATGKKTVEEAIQETKEKAKRKNKE